MVVMLYFLPGSGFIEAFSVSRFVEFDFEVQTYREPFLKNLLFIGSRRVLEGKKVPCDVKVCRF